MAQAVRSPFEIEDLGGVVHVLRGMVFVDHMNFDIALQNLYLPDEAAPKLDYNTVFKGIVEQRENVVFLKSFIFVPKPNDFLRRLPIHLPISIGR